MSPVLPEVCHRTRQHASLRLDSELSELEEALIASHLARCPGCSAFARELEAFTEVLRSAPLEDPAAHFELRRPRPARVGVAHAGSAAALAVSVAIALGVGLHSSPNRISDVDVAVAQERLSVKEQLLQELDSTGAQQVRQARPGLDAAEKTTLDHSPDAR